ncbi:MAG: helix-turn-helix transcriptional regulator [Treponema sp.]|nr:helix-turn-helix transcriptional regulator [Treponema sp.]
MTEEQIKSTFAKNLKFYREKSGLSQMSLASKAGLATNFINDIENRKRWISPATLSKLSEALGVSPYKFFTEVNLESSASDETVSLLCTELSNELSVLLNNFMEAHRLNSVQ